MNNQSGWNFQFTVTFGTCISDIDAQDTLVQLETMM